TRASAGHGSSTQESKSARCRRTSTSTPRRALRIGSVFSSPRRWLCPDHAELARGSGVVAVRVACRPRLRGQALMVHKLVEDLVHESKMATDVGELPLDIHQVAREPVKTGRGGPENC